MHIITMCGMSACFSALFGTPIAAAIFSMEVVSVGVMYYAALVPLRHCLCLAAQLAGWFGAAGRTAVSGFPRRDPPRSCRFCCWRHCARQ